MASTDALRLANDLDFWPQSDCSEAAAELRRLSAENERLYAQHASVVSDYEIQIADLVAQRDALLEALERIAQLSMSQFHIFYDMAAEACNIASAAIKQAEGENT